MNITVIGGGHVGLPLATALATFGHSVICCEHNARKRKAAETARAPFADIGLNETIAAVIADGNLRFCGDMKDAVTNADIVMAAVAASGGGDRQSDGLHNIAAAIAQYAPRHCVLAIKSTVKSGVCETLEKTHNIHVASNPEFLEQGRGLQGCLQPTRIIAGADCNHTRRALRTVYAPLITRGVKYIEISRASAEIAKLAANLFLSARIALINETADLCEETGGEIEEVTRALATDERIGDAYLRAGPGFGGDCLPKDGRLLAATANTAGVQIPAANAVYVSNRRRVRRLTTRLLQQLPKNSAIAVWGAAFKPKSDSIRHSPAISIMRTLEANGHHIRVCDPRVATATLKKALPAATLCNDFLGALDDTDALIVFNKDETFMPIIPSTIARIMRGSLVFDHAGVMNRASCQDAGLIVHILGVPAPDLHPLAYQRVADG